MAHTAEAVHVWRIPIPEHAPQELLAVLSAGERERAARYRAEADRVRFAVTRAAVRTILADRLGTTPERIRFAHEPNGKPRVLDGDGRPSPVRHSMSRAGRLALCAVAHERAVGVDIEMRSLGREALDAAERTFTDAERAYLGERSEVEAEEEALRIWTRKEALAKADGRGLGDAVWQVTLVSGEPVRLGPTTYEIEDLPVDDGYLATLCVAGGPAPIIRSDWRR